MTRADPASVIRPKFAEFWLVFGFQVTQLNYVERFDPDLDLGGGAGVERLVQAEIDVLRSRTAQIVAPRVPERAGAFGEYRTC